MCKDIDDLKAEGGQSGRVKGDQVSGGGEMGRVTLYPVKEAGVCPRKSTKD